jgi:hypothetical protein
MSFKRDEERTAGKRVRVPLGGPQLRLQLSTEDRQRFEDEGFVPRWVNDADGKIARAEAAGYVFVQREEVPSLGSGVIHQGSTNVGSKVSKVVSRGEPIITAYLMKTRKEYYEEDQLAKEANNAKVDEALAAGNAGGASVENQYGPGTTYSH